MARHQTRPDSSRWTRLRKNWKIIAGGLLVVAACCGIRLISGPELASAKPPATAADTNVASPAPPANSRPQVVAIVGGEEIQRQELANECLSHFGRQVLDTIVARELIADYCKQRNVVVTRKDVDDEIEKTASHFRLTVDQYLKAIEQERHIKRAQYAQDIVWPIVAKRKLVSAQITVNEQELREEFEATYGAAVKVRLIAVNDHLVAAKVQAAAQANPDDFGNLAKKYSKDVDSASVGGMIRPIHRHVGEQQIEDVAFSLKDQEVSPVVALGNQFVILKCEGHVPETVVPPAQREAMRNQLSERIRERKTFAATNTVMQQLQAKARVEIILGDPVKSKQLPGVAATINGAAITMRDLGEECVEYHGAELLEGIITRHLLAHALKKNNKTVGQHELDAEIAHAAVAMNKVDKNGRPDVKDWLDTITKQLGITVDTYVDEVVWPSAALKVLTPKVEVTDEDIRKGFEANYGPRVRALAIVLGTQRKAQEVWEMARGNLTRDNFGKLAEQYSIEPGTKAMKGQVDPIPRNGGVPQLEKEAFSLKPGELSGIVQLGDKYVILYCEGFTEPTKVDLKEVRGDLVDDIREKKERLAMSKRLNEIKESTEVTNFVAGTMHGSSKVAGGKPSGDDLRSAVRPVSGISDRAPR